MRTSDVVVRRSDGGDRVGLDLLYRDAFPNEPLMPLVEALLDLAEGVTSLVAVRDGCVVGHVMFTRGRVAGSDGPLALLGPLAVAPSAQRTGIGRALVAAGLSQLARCGVLRVLVLGDPAYYGRLGFVTETDIRPLYELPLDWGPAWQSTTPPGVGTLAIRGRLELPAPWLDKALWSP
jgi:putative acetyltransferase